MTNRNQATNGAATTKAPVRRATHVASVALALFGVAGAVAGCGGNGGGGNCGKVAACGGDVVGTWNLSTACASQAALSAVLAEGWACPTIVGSVSESSVSGSLTFNSDGNYAANNVRQAFTVNIKVPAACLNADRTCASLDASLKMQMSEEPSIVLAQCVAAGSDCTCKLGASESYMETGTYVRSGTVLTASGELSGGDYCVEGKTLHLLELDTTMNMGPMGTATITSDIVATKQ